MRHIGNLPDEKLARGFGDFLVASGIRNEMERDADGSWSVWIVEEDHIPLAQAALEKFRANPDAPEFRGATTLGLGVEPYGDQIRAFRVLILPIMRPHQVLTPNHE